MNCEDLDEEKLKKLYEIYQNIEKECGNSLVALTNWLLIARDWAEENDALKEYNAFVKCMDKEFRNRQGRKVN